MTDVNGNPVVTPNKWIPTPAVRKYIYGVIAALGAVGLLYGIVTQDQLNVWLQVVSNLLLIGGPALALVNTPGK
jgi:hypothetical protein